MSNATRNSEFQEKLLDVVTSHKTAAQIVGFHIFVVSITMSTELLGLHMIAAIIIAWLFFLYAVVVLFAIVPYYAIELVEYRHR